MLKLLSSVAILAALAAPTALHADTMNGQFSITGSSVTNSGTTLTFVPDSVSVGAANTLSGSFSSILSAGEMGTITNPIVYDGYIPGSASIVIGTGSSALTFDITSLTEVANGAVTAFTGVGTLTAAGYDPTIADLIFSTQGNGAVTFSATATAQEAPSVPEPSTLALMGTGLFGIAAFAKRRFAI